MIVVTAPFFILFWFSLMPSWQYITSMIYTHVSPFRSNIYKIWYTWVNIMFCWLILLELLLTTIHDSYVVIFEIMLFFVLGQIPDYWGWLDKYTKPCSNVGHNHLWMIYACVIFSSILCLVFWVPRVALHMFTRILSTAFDL